MSRARALALALLLCGCGETLDRAQVMVLIDAEPALRAHIAAVAIEVTSGTRFGEDFTPTYSGSLTPRAAGDWPLELSIVPRAGDAARGYAVGATALDAAGAPLLTLRAISGFARGRTLSLVLYFDGACVARAQPCGAELSCVAGRCENAHIDPSQLPDDTVDRSGVPFARPRSAPAGAPVIEIEPQAGAPAPMPDAGPAPDAGADASRSGDAATEPPPDAAAEPSDWRAIGIATGDKHTCVQLAGGAVKCWGANLEGELGQGHTDRIGDAPDELGDRLPALPLGRGRKVVELVAGGYHNCVRFEDGKVGCWGNSDSGSLGLGLSDGDHRGDQPGELDALPDVDLGTGYAVVQLAASWTHTCARLDYGAIKCWGLNDVGLLGLGDTRARGSLASDMGDALAEVELGDLPAKDLVVGDYHNCARLDNDRIKCFGANMFSGDTQPRGDSPDDMGEALPFVELGDGLSVVELSSGGYHMCARLIDQRIKCWGENSRGQLGLGDRAYRGGQPSDMGGNLAAVELGSGLHVVQLVSGRDHNCARFDDGRVKCWGSNERGQLGLGDRNDRGDQLGEMGDALPFIDLGQATRALRLASQEHHTCALLEDGSVKCWGENDEAQLGLGDAGNDRGDEPGEMGDALPAVDLGSR